MSTYTLPLSIKQWETENDSKCSKIKSFMTCFLKFITLFQIRIIFSCSVNIPCFCDIIDWRIKYGEQCYNTFWRTYSQYIVNCTNGYMQTYCLIIITVRYSKESRSFYLKSYQLCSFHSSLPLNLQTTTVLMVNAWGSASLTISPIMFTWVIR